MKMNIIEWGKIANTHGVRGELKVLPWLDFKALSKKVKKLTVDGKEYEIKSVRTHNETVLLTLEGIDTMEKAEMLKNKVITTNRSDIDLGEGHYFYSDLYGFEVWDKRTEQAIGRLVRVDSFPSNDVYVIKREHDEIMIPIVPAFERGVSLEDRKVFVSTIEGMLEDNED